MGTCARRLRFAKQRRCTTRVISFFLTAEMNRDEVHKSWVKENTFPYPSICAAFLPVHLLPRSHAVPLRSSQLLLPFSLQPPTLPKMAPRKTSTKAAKDGKGSWRPSNIREPQLDALRDAGILPPDPKLLRIPGEESIPQPRRDERICRRLPQQRSVFSPSPLSEGPLVRLRRATTRHDAEFRATPGVLRHPVRGIPRHCSPLGACSALA